MVATNLIDGKRWFDLMIGTHPQLEASAVDYTTTNPDASFNHFYGHPKIWRSLEMKVNFPKVVLETRWDVILVDAPLGYPNTGPGKYQSLYITNILAKSSEAMARLSNSHFTGLAVNVFVDDYEHKVKRKFS